MKDLPHHIKKLNRKVIRSMHRNEATEELLPDLPSWPDSERQVRKKAKIRMKKETASKVAHLKSPEERNKEMKRGRVPVFDRTNAVPKHAAPSKKKRPGI